MSIADLIKLGAVADKDSPGSYNMTMVPKPNSSFQFYYVSASKTYGLCRISGFSKDLNDDDFGTSIKLSFSSVKGALSQKYGESKDTDVNGSGGLSEPQNWMYNLKNKYRRLVSIWSEVYGSKIPDVFYFIELDANSTKYNTGYISLSYVFTNDDVCQAEIKNETGEGL